MSVVRRSSRCASSPTMPKAPTKPPSKETVVKSEMVKRYLEEYWYKISQQRASREERYNFLQQRLQESNLSEEEKQEVIEEFKKEETDFTRFSRSKLKPDNFTYIDLIGRGGFADVWLVTDKSKQIYALKIIRKKDVILNDQITAVRNERDILAISHNPWIVKLFCSFQDEEHLYLVLEFVQGGDIMNALGRIGTFPPQVARFFCAEIALALHSVHQLGFVHSDLKPDNILITPSGHIKLTDFGIASNYDKHDTEYHDLLASAHELLVTSGDREDNSFLPMGTCRHRKRNSVIGTVDYTAPEVLAGEPPSEKSDWWSFGVILFEMLYGYAPFSCESQKETALRVINWRKSLRIPINQRIQVHALMLLKQLLCDKKDRIGFEEIIKHPFFNGFNFDDIKSNKPPMRPICTDPLSTEHFEKYDVQPEDLRASATLTKLASFLFLGFTYKQKPPSVALAKLGITA